MQGPPTMKNFFLSSLLLLSTTLFTGCSSTDDVKPTLITHSNSLPSWYTEVPKNDNRYIYGQGMGETRKEAISNALNDAVATLNVSVSSNYKQETSSSTHNGVEDYDKKSQESVEIVTDELTLNNYEVVEQQHLDNGSDIVMIQINKYQLFTSLQTELDNSYKLLNINLQNKSNELEKILIYRKAMGQIKLNMKTLGIMHTLNPAFEDKTYKSQYKEVVSAHNKLVENKLFSLKINDPYGAYTAPIRKGLMQDGVKLTHGDSDDYDYIVRVNVEEQEKIAVKRHVVTYLTTTFSVGIGDNNSANDIFYSTFKLRSQSDESLEDAREILTDKLVQKIERHSVFNIPSE